MQIIELLLKIKSNVNIYYHKDTKKFDYKSYSDIQLNILDQKGPEEFCKLYGNKDDNNILLPTYKQLHHNEHMREFVKGFVEEKDTRKSLFSILSRRDYIDDFIKALKDFDLYDVFEDAFSEYYYDVFKEWLTYNKIEL